MRDCKLIARGDARTIDAGLEERRPREEDRVQDRDYRDIVGGMLVAAFGAAAALYSFAHYRLGSVVSMGPGMFPTALGGLLVVGGFLIAAGGVLRRGPAPTSSRSSPRSSGA